RIPKLSIVRIRKPRWHLFAENCSLDRLRPGARAFVGQKGHRRDAAWPMTALTVFLEDWQYILIEGREWGLIRGNGRGRNLRSQCRHRRQQNENEKSSHTVLPKSKFVIWPPAVPTLFEELSYGRRFDAKVDGRKARMGVTTETQRHTECVSVVTLSISGDAQHEGRV